MRDFGSIVGISLNNVSHIGKDGSHGSGIASQLVGNNPHWFGGLQRNSLRKNRSAAR